LVAGNHPDFRRVELRSSGRNRRQKGQEAEQGIKIEQIANPGFLYVKSRDGLRVALIHPANDMQQPAYSALLKGLEEPPPGVVFILVTPRPALLPATIRSRCVALPVAVPSRDAALAWMAGQGVKGAERWLAYAGGAPLRALSTPGWPKPSPGSLIPGPVDDRDKLEQLAESLQKTAWTRLFRPWPLPGIPGARRAPPDGMPG
jgi:hypothetical protein